VLPVSHASISTVVEEEEQSDEENLGRIAPLIESEAAMVQEI
jgi:hypothetical protein